MAIDFNNSRINGIQPDSELFQRRQRLGGEPQGQTFGDMLSNAIDSVDNQMDTADQKVSDVVSGKSENIHDVMISMQKAQLSFQLMTEIRNKAIDTYQQLSRMQI